MALNYHMEILNKGDIQEGGKISIPSYQRGIVWKLKHKKEFLESLKSGDPIGVVLVYKEENGTFTLIDGLQRLSTIKAYINNPLSFIDEKDKFINESSIEEIIKEKYKLLEQTVPKESIILKQKKQFKKTIIELSKSKDLPEGYDIWPSISEKLEFPNDTGLAMKFIKFYQEFKNNLKLDDDIKIQAIVYDGPKENLPTVFHNLNTGSVSLTKYEIFASIWPRIQMKFDDESIIAKVIDKYDNLRKNSNFEVEVSEEEIRNNGITLFEYCYSIGEILTDSEKDYSFLFSPNSDKKSAEPVGFDLLALACGLPVNKAQSLCETKYLNGSSPQFLTDFKNALVDCSTIVSEAIKKWVFDYRNNCLKNDSLYQIYHMIIAVFKNKYDLDLKIKRINKKDTRDSKKWIENFNKYAYIHYLFDTVTNFWSINRQVSDLKREIDSEESTSKYTFDLSKEKIKNGLMAFADESIAKATEKAADSTTKLLLNYYYKLKEKKARTKYFVSSKELIDENYSFYFDIEHIVPKEKFERFPNETFSKSYIGNLCYLAIKDNRSKRDLTLYEYADSRPALTLDEDFIRFIDYPSREELGFINCSLDEFRKSYENFIKERGNRVLNEITNLIANE